MCAKSRESRRYAGKEVKRTEKRCHKMEEIILRNARVSPCVPHTHIYSFPPTYAIGQLRPTKSRRDRWEGLNSARGRPTYMLSAPFQWGHFQGLTLHTSWTRYVVAYLLRSSAAIKDGHYMGWAGLGRQGGNIMPRQEILLCDKGVHVWARILQRLTEVPRLK